MAKPLVLTSGEPAGIGPDITIKAWLARNELRLPPFYVAGDCGLFHDRAKALGLDVKLADVRAEDALGAFAHALPVMATGSAATARPGQPDGTSAEAALASIRHAVGDVVAGRAGAVVTNPIAKSVLYRAGFRHPGHTGGYVQINLVHRLRGQRLWDGAGPRLLRLGHFLHPALHRNLH